MNKSLIGFLSLLITLFIVAFYYSGAVQSPFLSILTYIKSSYRNSVEYIENSFEEHTFQAKHIEKLNNQLRIYKNEHLIIKEISAELNDLFKENNSSLKTNPEVELTRVISYAEFGNFNKIWLEIKDYNSSKIYGLVYKNLVAGVVIPSHHRPLALLNRDIKSSYSVYIGEEKAPGIAHGNNSENLIVEFIPAWYNIKIGDEVLTSSLDNIFFRGLKVGKVIDITSSQGYQNAIVKPYYRADVPDYFHIIKRVK